MYWFRFRIWQAKVTLLALLFCSCSKQDDALPPKAPRTLLVYLGCDNNLSSEAALKLAALAKGAKGCNGNLLVYQDAAGENGTPKLWRITSTGEAAGTVTLEKEYAEHSSASSQVFGQVVLDVLQQYPASSYGLLVFSHGSGWLPKGALANPKSIIIDGMEEMEIEDFANALPDRTFDYIVFEACFMASVEVAYQLRKKAKHIVASAAEILSPGFVRMYEANLPMLFEEKPNLRGFAEAYYNHYNNMHGGYRSATVSVVCTDSLERLAQSVRQCRAFSDSAIAYGTIQHFDRISSTSNRHIFYDLEDVIKKGADSLTYRTFKKVLDKCVLYKKSTPVFMQGSYGGFAISTHCGLTAYIENKNFSVLNEYYRKTSWRRAVNGE